MGNGMNKIISGVYVGNYRDAKDAQQLADNGITHILSIHDNAKPLLDDKKYLCIIASDTPNQPLAQFFPQCIEFIHEARLDNGRVLIHCLAGVSRSVTVTAAYLMTVTSLGWRDSVNSIRGARNAANPNFGFQKQLQDYEYEDLPAARTEMKTKYPSNPFDDEKECAINLKSHRNFVMTGDSTKEASSDNLYSLPHRAYGDRNKRHAQDFSTENTNSNSTSSNASGSKDSNCAGTSNSGSSGAGNTVDSGETNSVSSGVDNSVSSGADDSGNTSAEKLQHSGEDNHVESK